MSAVIIHTADLHIGKSLPYLSEKAQTRRNEVLLNLKNIIDVCIKNNADALIIAGDLFDSPSPAATVVDETFSILAACPVPVIIAAGNHDCLQPDSPYLSKKLPPNVKVFTKENQMYDLGGKATVWGVSFYDYYMQNCALPVCTGEAPKILAVHGDFAQNSDYNPLTVQALQNTGADYAALGHIHKKSAPQKAGGLTFAYSGTPEGQGFDELDECGVYKVVIDNDLCEVTFIKTGSRMHVFEQFDITGITDTNEICNIIIEKLKSKYKEDYTKNLYKIRLIGQNSAPVNRNLIADALSQELFFVKVSDNTTPVVDLKLLAKEPTLKGLFVKKMLENLEDITLDEKEVEYALQIGLAAFEGEVAYNEDN